MFDTAMHLHPAIQTRNCQGCLVSGKGRMQHGHVLKTPRRHPLAGVNGQKERLDAGGTHAGNGDEIVSSFRCCFSGVVTAFAVFALSCLT